MEHPFVAMVRELSEGFTERAPALLHSEIAIDDTTVLRARLLAWLLGK